MSVPSQLGHFLCWSIVGEKEMRAWKVETFFSILLKTQLN